MVKNEMTNHAVCLISGGIDSSVTAYIAHEQGYRELFALSFKYGQLHGKEIACAKKIGGRLNVKEHIFFDLNLRQFGGSSLVDTSIKFPDNTDVFKSADKTIPSTYVPARNTIFLSIALAYAEIQKAEAIFIGVTATDYAGYPDCRPEYIKAFQQVANLGTKRGVEGKTIDIKTPLLHLSKKEIITKGMQLEVPFEDTWSCYRGRKQACGQCDSCLYRLKGFMEADIMDPISYECYPKWYSLEKR